MGGGHPWCATQCVLHSHVCTKDLGCATQCRHRGLHVCSAACVLHARGGGLRCATQCVLHSSARTGGVRCAVLCVLHSSACMGSAARNAIFAQWYKRRGSGACNAMCFAQWCMHREVWGVQCSEFCTAVHTQVVWRLRWYSGMCMRRGLHTHHAACPALPLAHGCGPPGSSH